ncbi:hypothetical protein DYU11_04945 [Fibrisoma montanum]|uniref:Uncharacterized protein n=1 Tax=Fibrisoma montanum TaxID=2305895 RepID=A0A418MJS0_9BACT|nr:hypothetical protein [Fibrisoma montanum]RIV27654.1 hypothetical protein DYU11_04945 [Fibrisoma montanum]
MKKLLIAGMMVLAVCGEGYSMGHPRNIFAAHKRLKAKKAHTTASIRPSACRNQATVSAQHDTDLGTQIVCAISKSAARLIYSTVVAQ